MEGFAKDGRGWEWRSGRDGRRFIAIGGLVSDGSRLLLKFDADILRPSNKGQIVMVEVSAPRWLTAWSKEKLTRWRSRMSSADCSWIKTGMKASFSEMVEDFLRALSSNDCLSEVVVSASKV